MFREQESSEKPLKSIRLAKNIAKNIDKTIDVFVRCVIIITVLKNSIVVYQHNLQLEGGWKNVKCYCEGQ